MGIRGMAGDRTDAEQQRKLPWRIDGPDADGAVWFEWEGEGPSCRFNLGGFDDVGEALCAWLARNDFGECG